MADDEIVPGQRAARGEQLVIAIINAGRGSHAGAWRLPDSRVEGKHELALFRDLCSQAEAAKIHAWFLADGLRLGRDTIATQPEIGLEPLTLLSALSAVTNHLGLIASVSTTFSEPFTVARQLASLDHLSGGRAGWNLVTSSMGEENFGRSLPSHDERYERGAEFAEVVTSLWDSWQADAFVVDRASGRYADPDKIRPIDFHGKYFDVAGPLNVPRTPQGRPIIAQAGSSTTGQEVAARFADLVFTTGRNTEEDSREFYVSLKDRVHARGRRRDSLKILPGISPILGQTEAEAKAIERELHGFIDLEAGRARLKRQLSGTFIDDLELDEAIPVERLPADADVEGRRSRFGVFKGLIEQGWTVRRLVEYEVTASGHFSFACDPEQLANLLQKRFEAGTADGFMLNPSYLPGGFDLITDAVIPLLQDRGVFQRQYRGSTLRENLGLAPL